MGQAGRIRKAFDIVGSYKVGDIEDYLISKYRVPPTRSEIINQLHIIRGEKDNEDHSSTYRDLLLITPTVAPSSERIMMDRW